MDEEEEVKVYDTGIVLCLYHVLFDLERKKMEKRTHKKKEGKEWEVEDER